MRLCRPGVRAALIPEQLHDGQMFPPHRWERQSIPSGAFRRKKNAEFLQAGKSPLGLTAALFNEGTPRRRAGDGKYFLLGLGLGLVSGREPGRSGAPPAARSALVLTL